MIEYSLSKKEATKLAKFIQDNPDEILYKLVVSTDSGIGTTYKIMTVESDGDVVKGSYEDITDYDTW